MVKRRTVRAPKKAADAKNGGAAAEARPEPVIVQGIWGVVYLAIAALLLIAMLFYSPRQHGGGTETHLLGPYLGTALALGMFYIFGRVTAAAFAVGVGYIGLMKLKNRPMPVKLLLWCALLAIELCALFAIGRMPQLSASGGFWKVMDNAGVNLVGTAAVNMLVPLFRGRVFGPYFIVLLVMAITVMVGLRVKPQSVFAVLSELFAALADWVKRAVSDIKTSIKNSPDIRSKAARQEAVKEEAPKIDVNAATPAVVRDRTSGRVFHAGRNNGNGQRGI